MKRLMNVVTKLFVAIMFISFIITGYWYGTNYGEYQQLKDITYDNIYDFYIDEYEGTNEFFLNFMLNNSGFGPNYVHLSYSHQLIDIASFCAEVFAIQTVYENSNDIEQYNINLNEITNKYSFYNEVPKKFNIFSELINLEDIEDTTYNLKNIDMEVFMNTLSDELHELSFYSIFQNIAFNFFAIFVVYNLVNLIMKLKKKNNKDV